MKFFQTFQRKKTQSPTAYSLIDVGRSTVKTAVVLMLPGNNEPQVVGYGLADTGNHDITGGRNEAEAVVEAVNRALIQAEDSAEQYIGQKIVPDEAVFAVAGRAVYGRLFTVKHTRPRPHTPIVPKELATLRLRAERLIPKGLAALAYEGGQWQPLAMTDAGTLVDGRLVLGPEGLPGRELTVSVFGVAVQASALRALEVLAEALNLSIANVVAAPHALASVTPAAEAVILDVGFSGTDMCIIRQDALVATEWVPFGGYFFSQSLAQALNIEHRAAAAITQAYAAAELSDEEGQRVQLVLEPTIYRWYNGVMEALSEFAVDEPLPRRIFLTGGASRLPGLDYMLKLNPGPFEAAPEVAPLGRKTIPAIKDLTDSMNYTLLALALSLTIGLPEFG